MCVRIRSSNCSGQWARWAHCRVYCMHAKYMCTEIVKIYCSLGQLSLYSRPMEELFIKMLLIDWKHFTPG